MQVDDVGYTGIPVVEKRDQEQKLEELLETMQVDDVGYTGIPVVDGITNKS
jgi:hypothetical protein